MNADHYESWMNAFCDFYINILFEMCVFFTQCTHAVIEIQKWSNSPFFSGNPFFWQLCFSLFYAHWLGIWSSLIRWISNQVSHPLKCFNNTFSFKRKTIVHGEQNAYYPLYCIFEFYFNVNICFSAACIEMFDTVIWFCNLCVLCATALLVRTLIKVRLLVK